MSDLKLISLEVENVKRVKAVRIDPNGPLTCIGGNNAQGKSSVLDSIVFALAGGRNIDAKPLRDGEENGKIVLDLGEYLVTRRFTKKGTSLKVEGTLNEDGKRPSYGSGQDLLNGFFNKFSFDPVAFVGMRPKDQLEQVKALVGLDFDDADANRRELFDQRTEIGRRGKSVAGELENLTFNESAPDQELSASELFAELNAANKKNAENRAAWEKADALFEKKSAADDEVERLRAALDEARDRAKELGDEHSAAVAAVKGLKDVDVEPINERLKNIDVVNAAVRENAKYRDAESRKEQLAEEYKTLTAKIAEIDREKAEAMAKAEFPVEGLGFDENGLTFNGLPFEQSSSAEQLRVSVAMGFAANPKLKLLLVKDGSLLDDNSLELIRSLAEKENAQVIMERVGKGQECSFIIEDGEVL